MTPLTDKQQLFITEYVQCFNASEAARRAGYKGDSTVEGSRLLAKLSQYIDEAKSNLIMSPDEVLIHLSAIARGDIGDVIDAVGAPDVLAAKEARRSNLIKKVYTKTTYTKDDEEIHEVTIEMYDRLKALEILAKYHQLTNTIKVEDWHSEIIALLREGKITIQEVEEELGYDTAREMVISIGAPILPGIQS